MSPEASSHVELLRSCCGQRYAGKRAQNQHWQLPDVVLYGQTRQQLSTTSPSCCFLSMQPEN